MFYVLWETFFFSFFYIFKSAYYHRELYFISCVVYQGLSQGAKNKISIVGSASLNLAEYAAKTEEHIEVKIPLTVSGLIVECLPLLCVSSCTSYIYDHKYAHSLSL